MNLRYPFPGWATAIADLVEEHGFPEAGQNPNGRYAMFPDGFLVMELSPDAEVWPCAITPPEPLKWYAKAAMTGPVAEPILIEKRWR